MVRLSIRPIDLPSVTSGGRDACTEAARSPAGRAGRVSTSVLSMAARVLSWDRECMTGRRYGERGGRKERGAES